MIPGILLAAGASSRMGQAKQLLDWRGQPLVRHVAQQALASTLDGLLVVVGYEAAAVRAALDGLPVQFVENAAYTEGQASSLRAGLAALPVDVDATVVLLCDQPLVTAGLIDKVAEAFGEAVGSEDEKAVGSEQTEGGRQKAEGSEQAVGSRQSAGGDTRRETRDGELGSTNSKLNTQNSKLVTAHHSRPVAIIPRYQGQRGNPVLLARAIFAELAHLHGDEGARGVLGRYRERVRWLDLDDPAVTTDVDTLEAYEVLKNLAETKDEGRRTNA